VRRPLVYLITVRVAERVDVSRVDIFTRFNLNEIFSDSESISTSRSALHLAPPLATHLEDAPRKQVLHIPMVYSTR
jgi:hypothetical protein